MHPALQLQSPQSANPDTKGSSHRREKGQALYGTLSDPGSLSDPEPLQNCSLSDTGKIWPISIKLCGLRKKEEGI